MYFRVLWGCIVCMIFRRYLEYTICLACYIQVPYKRSGQAVCLPPVPFYDPHLITYYFSYLLRLTLRLAFPWSSYCCCCCVGFCFLIFQDRGSLCCSVDLELTEIHLLLPLEGVCPPPLAKILPFNSQSDLLFSVGINRLFCYFF